MERWLSKRIQTNPLSREILLIVPSTCNAADYLDASLAAKGVLELQNPGIRGGSSSDVSSVSMFAIVFNQLLREMDDGGDERPRQGERQRRIPLAVSPSSVVSNVDCEESCIGCSLLSAAPLSSFLSSRDSVFHRAARRRSNPLKPAQTRSRDRSSLLPPRIESRSDVCYRCQSTFLRFRRHDENRPRHDDALRRFRRLPPPFRFPRFRFA